MARGKGAQHHGGMLYGRTRLPAQPSAPPPPKTSVTSHEDAQQRLRQLTQAVRLGNSGIAQQLALDVLAWRSTPRTEALSMMLLAVQDLEVGDITKWADYDRAVTPVLMSKTAFTDQALHMSTKAHMFVSEILDLKISVDA
jgi:hypothetical protein